ncbi:hypothetical protein [Sphingobacterium rhinopitheci]|uniref:hypothetical protein n=1 Tax=Sphingobacterium rhinopitheci TaxID=2781960 RepID=UPI001F517FE5|nr:hypothetical protein [Sphingobacterium rhinopitheci]MCI0921990.1 hypothetical protein [Sphingobacterium rhinopitheci]
MRTKFIYLTLAGIAICGTASAQVDGQTATHGIDVTIPLVSIIDIEATSGANISFSFTAPNEAGEAIVAPTANNSLWLNYSTIVAENKTKQISVKLSNLIDGATIGLVAGPDAGEGGGIVGGPTTIADGLTTADKPLITAIGSAYTGTGTEKGHQLTYTLTPTNSSYGAIIGAAAKSTTVTYTISDEL